MAQAMSPVDYANLPVTSPPAGVLPNLEHPASRAMEAYVAMGICIGITLVFLVLRLYTKLCITHLWGWDDGESPCSGHLLWKLRRPVACVLGWVSQTSAC